jgi:hypothetical protein
LIGALFEEFVAADERRSTRIENKNLIGIDLRSSAAISIFFTASHSMNRPPQMLYLRRSPQVGG